MPISTRKPPRTAEEFIGAAEDQQVVDAPKDEKTTDIVHDKKEQPVMTVEGQGEEAYIRDKRFLLSIPFQLHKLAAEKAKVKKMSLHEFILKATDRAIKEE